MSVSEWQSDDQVDKEILKMAKLTVLHLYRITVVSEFKPHMNVSFFNHHVLACAFKSFKCMPEKALETGCIVLLVF